MKSFTAVGALALFASAAVAQNATVVDPFASITTQAPYAKCASGPAYKSCDSVLAQRAECTFTESAASASCSCAYASSRMACNAICTDSQIDLAIDCPKPTSWSYYPGWGSTAETTKSKPSASKPTGYGDCAETWGYSGSWTSKKPTETGTGASGKPSGTGYWSNGGDGSKGSSSTATSTSAKTTATVAMQTTNAAARPTGAAAAAVIALAGVAGALL